MLKERFDVVLLYPVSKVVELELSMVLVTVQGVSFILRVLNKVI